MTLDRYASLVSRAGFIKISHVETMRPVAVWDLVNHRKLQSTCHWISSFLLERKHPVNYHSSRKFMAVLCFFWGHDLITSMVVFSNIFYIMLVCWRVNGPFCRYPDLDPSPHQRAFTQAACFAPALLAGEGDVLANTNPCSMYYWVNSCELKQFTKRKWGLRWENSPYLNHHSSEGEQRSLFFYPNRWHI